MNFRFAHYDPPKPKPKKTISKACTQKSSQLQQRSSRVQQKRQQESAKKQKEQIVQLLSPASTRRSVTPSDELIVPSQALNTIIGQGRLDPFSVYPVDAISPYVHEVLDHAINNKWANVSPSPTPVTTAASTHPVKRGWLQCAISSPVAFYALFYAASQHLNYLQRGNDSCALAPTLRLSYKTKAISLINRELSHLNGEPLPDALLIAILSLGAHGNKPVSPRDSDTTNPKSPLASAQMLDFYGHIDQETAHMSALRSLLAHNRGVDDIRLPGLVGALQLGDVLHSTITDREPALASTPSTLPETIAIFSDSTFCPVRASRLGQSKAGCKLVEILQQARALTAALAQYTDRHTLHTSSTPTNVDMDDLIHARNLVHHNLISLGKANGLWGASLAIYDSVRLACRIYSDLVFFPLPAETKVRMNLALQLRQALDAVTLHNGWRGETRVLLWCCILGAIAAQEVGGMQGVAIRSWIRARIRRCAAMLEMSEWEGEGGAEVVCEKVLWWDYVCGGRGKAVWKSVVSETGVGV